MHHAELKNHRIHSQLGRGGMAIVYLAHDNKFDSNVAVKVLNKEFVHNENIRKRFLAEARNMFKMSHPNIIKVTDLIEDGDTVAFVMEYIEGETLKEYIDRKGKLNDEEIKKIFTQILDAVGYVHEQNLVHRDIKPSNLMISNKGVVKLLDFGIAKNTDVKSSEYTMTGTTQYMGTPMYMSPEQIKSTKDVTHQTDIYSLGVVLWQMVTGRKPYDSNELSVPEIQVSILKEELPLTSTMWDGIIKAAMQKSVELRFQQCSMMKEHIVHAQITSTKFPKEVDFDQITIIENNDSEKKQVVTTIPSTDKKVENKNQDPPAGLHDIVDIEKKSNENDKRKRFITIALFILGFLFITLIVYNQNERKLLEEWRSYRDNREDNGKVYLSKALWKKTIYSGSSIDYREIYEESPDQIVFPFDDEDILTNAINKDCFARWLKEYEQGGKGFGISIWDDKPVYIGFNGKKELIVFYTDGTTQNTVTQKTKTWSCD